MRIARRFVISGRVQGVGFRYFTQDAARREGLHGFVRNNDDGTVEAVQVDGAGLAIGVQWHAELLVERSEHLALFEALVRAAESRAGDTAEAA